VADAVEDCISTMLSTEDDREMEIEACRSIVFVCQHYHELGSLVASYLITIVAILNRNDLPHEKGLSVEQAFFARSQLCGLCECFET
jgi:hypothetical protein